ncbi:MAG: hypothetical protein IH852_01825 [Bacteroidetes bacterium]|nr:hypothetical protein [Bacteroidota bacterium]
MKIIIFLSFLPIFIFAQTKSLNLGGNNIELGMDEESVYELLGPKFRLDVDEYDNLFISDNSSDLTIGIINFENGRVNKIVKDWGTGHKNNVAGVFKTLWNIFRQFGEETALLKAMPTETYTPTGEEYSLQFYINEYRYVDIKIFHSIYIYEVLAEPEI